MPTGDVVLQSGITHRATRLASALRARGLGRGDNVGIALHNSAEYLEAFLACCKIGAAPANVNYRYVADELHYLLNTLELKALFHGPDLREEVGKIAAKLPQLRLCVQAGTAMAGQDQPIGDQDYETLLGSGRPDLSDPERSDNDVYLLCTGGTTGMPKGVMWPHKSLFDDARRSHVGLAHQLVFWTCGGRQRPASF